MKFCTNVHVPQLMNPKDFEDPLTFPPVPCISTAIELNCGSDVHFLLRMNELVSVSMPMISMLSEASETSERGLPACSDSVMVQRTVAGVRAVVVDTLLSELDNRAWLWQKDREMKDYDKKLFALFFTDTLLNFYLSLLSLIVDGVPVLLCTFCSTRGDLNKRCWVAITLEIFDHAHLQILNVGGGGANQRRPAAMR